MAQIILTLKGHQLSVVQEAIASETYNYLTAEIQATDDWASTALWVYFKQGGSVYRVLSENGVVSREKHLDLGPGKWLVWCIGFEEKDGDLVQRITSTVDSINVQHTGALGGAYLPISPPSAGEQILAVAQDAKSIAQAVQAEADAGAFNGKGVPAGGSAGQVLMKTGAEDYETGWGSVSGGGGSDSVWYPTVSADGEISWERSSSTTAPTARNIRGPAGAKGDSGAKGDTGATPDLQIGTVTTLDAGSNATASITGTAENPVLNLGIPKGAKGADGSGGGGSTELQLIGHVLTTEAETTNIAFTQDADGNALDLQEAFLFMLPVGNGTNRSLTLFNNDSPNMNSPDLLAAFANALRSDATRKGYLMVHTVKDPHGGFVSHCLANLYNDAAGLANEVVRFNPYYSCNFTNLTKYNIKCQDGKWGAGTEVWLYGR